MRVVEDMMMEDMELQIIDGMKMEDVELHVIRGMIMNRYSRLFYAQGLDANPLTLSPST